MAAQTKKMVPQIRFKGFTEEWEAKTLKESVDVIGTGKSSFIASPIKSHTHPYPVLGSRSIIGYDKNHDYDGDFILTARVGENAGKLYQYSGKVKITDNTVYIKSASFTYVFYLLSAFDLTKISFGTGQPLIKASELSGLIIKNPNCYVEQSQIGTYFQELDQMIGLHQQKHDKLVTLKKAMLKKMFPQNGATTPEIRFKGFSEPWEERALVDEVTFFSGLTYSPGDVVGSGGTLVLRSSNVKNGEIIDADNVYVDSNVVNCENVQHGDIIVVVRNGSRSLIGKHAQIKGRMSDTVIGAFMTGIRSEQPMFINALLDTPQFGKEVEKSMGATINQITAGTFNVMRFRFPGLKEQQKIGTYFRQLDALIAQHGTQLAKLQQIKTACLEKMFV